MNGPDRREQVRVCDLLWDARTESVCASGGFGIGSQFEY
jgi:hypothetical protein